MESATRRETNATTRLRRRYVDGAWGQLHIREIGTPRLDRPSLICFHMSPMTGRIYESFMVQLAALGDRHVVAFDTPGFGASDAPNAPPEIADYAATMMAALAAMGLDGPVDLMGYHTGSMIACEAAATLPGRVRRLILISAPIFTEEDLEEMHAEYRPNPPREDGSHLVHRWLRFSHHFGQGGMTIDQINDAFPDALLGRNIEHWGHRAAFRFAPGMRLSEVEQPILLLNPQDDLRSHTMRAPPLLRNGRMVLLDGWGHGFLDVHGEAAARLVDSFVAAPDNDPFGNLAEPSPQLKRETQ